MFFLRTISTCRTAQQLLCLVLGCVGLLVRAESLAAQDLVEFLDGRVVSGEIIEIRKDAKEFDFRSAEDASQEPTTYPYADVHAVTFKGRRFELTPMKSESTGGAKEESGASAGLNIQGRSEAEVKAEIQKAGITPPDWFESTAMNHPKTLDLDWPMKPEGPWDESKNVGQYIWGRVNPNESRWHSGIKLVHECVARHAKDAALLKRDMEKLGEMYFTLLQDYPRAAFWFEKARVDVSKPTGVHLAECYWRLGNKKMALDMLRGKSVNVDAIKLLGDMGELDEALRVAEVFIQKTSLFNEAWLNAGDALRKAGQLDRAIEYYQKVLDKNKARNAEYLARYKARASGAIEAIQLFDKADVQRVADGSYRDASTGYNGQLEVEVAVLNSKITSLRVTKHNEKQFYAALTDTPQQIISKQSVRDIDGTSGATITAQAIIHATARALAQGAR